MNMNMIPNELVRQTQQASGDQAKNYMSQALGMANTYLQGLKQMAGGLPSQPMRTMGREQMDLDNGLTRANEFMAVSGKVPEMDFLEKVGLQGTLGPMAGQQTLDTKNAQDDLAMRWYNATKSGSGGGGGGGGPTFSQQLSLMKYQDEQNAAQEKDINDWVNRILKETDPVNSTSIDLVVNGHAMPQKALQKYRGMMGNELYDEVARRVMSTFAKAPTTPSATGTIPNAGIDPNSFFK